MQARVVVDILLFLNHPCVACVAGTKIGARAAVAEVTEVGGNQGKKQVDDSRKCIDDAKV